MTETHSTQRSLLGKAVVLVAVVAAGLMLTGCRRHKLRFPHRGHHVVIDRRPDHRAYRPPPPPVRIARVARPHHRYDRNDHRDERRRRRDYDRRGRRDDRQDRHDEHRRRRR